MNTVDKIVRIGILGGTFDPIHLGHIIPAKEIFLKYALDKLLIIPAHKPPHKDIPNTPTEHRVNMVKLVCDQEPNFILDTREIKRSSLSYTIETLKEIKSEYPNSELFFIMGMDSLLEFTTWTEWEEIIQLSNLIVNTRPNYDISTLNKETELLLKNYSHQIINNPTEHGVIYVNNSNEIDISSTEIRQEISKNTHFGKWLPDAVACYIKNHNLYK